MKKIGPRSLADELAEPSNLGPGSLTEWLGWFANRIRAITGMAQWFEDLLINLKSAAAHVGSNSNPTMWLDQIGLSDVPNLIVVIRLTSLSLPALDLSAIKKAQWNSQSASSNVILTSSVIEFFLGSLEVQKTLPSLYQLLM